MNEMRGFWWISLLLLFFIGCSAVGRKPLEMEMKVKKMRPPEGKALVYIVRSSGFFGAQQRMEVTCDGKYIGATYGKTFIYAILNPGSYLFVSKAENISELPIALEAGKTYYFEQKVKLGFWKERNELERLDDVEGQKKLNKCFLSSDFVHHQLKWKFRTEDFVQSSPTIADSVVYFGSWDDHLYAVDIQMGQEKWRFKTAGDVVSSPAIEGGVVYFGSWDGHLYAVDIQTGQEKWRFKTAGDVQSSPTIANSVVYFGSWDGHLYAVDIQTGELKWKFKTEHWVESSPAIAQGVVYFGSFDGHLYAVRCSEHFDK
jgi:hypothetical protein